MKNENQKNNNRILLHFEIVKQYKMQTTIKKLK